MKNKETGGTLDAIPFHANPDRLHEFFDLDPLEGVSIEGGIVFETFLKQAYTRVLRWPILGEFDIEGFFGF